MATRNKRKLAALNKENCEEHPRGNLAQNSNVPRSEDDCINQVSEEIELREESQKNCRKNLAEQKTAYYAR